MCVYVYVCIYDRDIYEGKKGRREREKERERAAGCEGTIERFIHFAPMVKSRSSIVPYIPSAIK
jgi:hypothetical protein